MSAYYDDISHSYKFDRGQIVPTRFLRVCPVGGMVTPILMAVS